jgi:hypothetical protein
MNDRGSHDPAWKHVERHLTSLMLSEPVTEPQPMATSCQLQPSAVMVIWLVAFSARIVISPRPFLINRRSSNAPALAAVIAADPALLYRLLRALASIGLLAECEGRIFRLTQAGIILRDDHPKSLRAMALREERRHGFGRLDSASARMRNSSGSLRHPRTLVNRCAIVN